MSRPMLSLNITEDRLVERVSAMLERERRASAPKTKRSHACREVIILNGRRYVAEADTAAGDALFSGLNRGGRDVA